MTSTTTTPSFALVPSLEAAWQSGNAPDQRGHQYDNVRAAFVHARQQTPILLARQEAADAFAGDVLRSSPDTEKRRQQPPWSRQKPCLRAGSRPPAVANGPRYR